MITAVTDDAPLNRGRLTESDVVDVSRHFDLGAVREVTFLPSGLMNQNWRFDTDAGAFAVKRVTDVPIDLARRNLRVTMMLADRGHPVAQPATTRTGDPVLQLADAAYCVVPWVPGSQPRGLDLGSLQAGELGAVLAALHTGLDTVGEPLLPPAASGPSSRVSDPVRAAAEADRFLRLATQAGAQTAFDRDVVEFVQERKILLEKFGHLRPMSDTLVGPFGWTHGDFQHLNLIWGDGRVAAVLDWDRIRVRLRAEEVARSATLLFGHDDGWLDLDRVSAFVAGYRRTVGLDEAALFDAVDRLWWKRMCDYWHLEFHYDRADHSCDHLFLSASRFLSWWTERLDEVRSAFCPDA